MIGQYRVEFREIINSNDVTNPRILWVNVKMQKAAILIFLSIQLIQLGKVQYENRKRFQIRTRLVTPNSIPASHREELINSSVVL